MPVQLTLMGAPAVEVDGSRTERFRSRRIPALLAYLSLRGGQVDRTAAASDLWPGQEKNRQLHCLRQTSLYCQKLLGPGVVLSGRGLLSLSDRAACDLRDWMEAPRREGFCEEPVYMEWARRHEAGLLPGWTDPWLAEARAEMSQTFVQATIFAVESLLDERPEEALAAARTGLRLEPGSRGLLELLARCLRRQGLHSQAEAEERRWRSLAESGGPPEGAPAHPGEDLSLDAAVLMLVDRGQKEDAVKLMLASEAPFRLAGRQEQALNLAVRVQAGAERASSAMAELLLCRARLLADLGRWQEAMLLVDECLASRLPIEIKRQALFLGTSLSLRLRRIPQAAGLLSQSLRLVRDAHGRGELLRACVLARETAFQQGNFKRAESLAVTSLKLSGELDDTFGRLAALCMIIASRLARSLSLGSELERFDALCLQVPCTQALLFHKLSLARSLEGAGDLEGALARYEEASRESAEIQAKDSMAVGLTYLGDLQERMGRSQEALGCHERALRVRAASGDLLGRACSLRGLAKANLGLGRLDLARDQALQAAGLFRECSDLNGHVSARFLLCLIERRLGLGESAVQVAEKALRSFSRLPEGALERMGPSYAKVHEEVRLLVEGDE